MESSISISVAVTLPKEAQNVHWRDTKPNIPRVSSFA
jgi:hypothetical protein